MNRDFYLLKIFKYATSIHIICLLIDLLCHEYMTHYEILSFIIQNSLLISTLCISIIISLKTIQFFTKTHTSLIHRYQAAAFIIESCVAAFLIGLLFFNQKITGKFIEFINHLSQDAHNNTIAILITFISLILCMELYHTYKMNRASIQASSIKKTLISNIIVFTLKMLIIMTTTIGYFHPLTKFLNPAHIREFNSIILHFTMTEFFLYIHTIIIILVGLWIAAGFYYFYKKYKK